jgi:hypothetical protein
MKTLVLSILLAITLQANASIADWFEKIANKAVGLDTSIITISNIKYSNYVSDVQLPAYFGNSIRELTTVSGRALNTSNSESVKTIVFKYEILECNSSGQSCTTIDEDEERWRTNIPPGQVRYFEHTIGYTPGDIPKHIYYRQNIKYVYPYNNI